MDHIQKSRILGVYVPGALLEQLEAIAREQRRTKSQVARLILERVLGPKEATA